MVDNITISPQSAANAGCTATFELIDSDSYDSNWWKMWKFTATAAQGWVFDHWNMSYSYQGPDPSDPSGNFTMSNGNSTWSYGAFSQEGTEEWDCKYDGFFYFRDSWRTITSMTAVFRFVHVPTKLIIRSATSGIILRGASGAILRDE